MENKINIAELLKDCPSGMELDCTMFDDIYFDYVDRLNIIHCYIQYETHKTSIIFNQHGTFNSDIKSKCLIFPKGKTTWEGFTPPCKFKDGDIVAFDTEEGAQLFIFKEYIRNHDYVKYAKCYMMLNCDGEIGFKSGGYYVKRLATKKEKQKLFQAIKDNGYKWNEETKTLEKLIEPKFKVGDVIQNIDTYKVKITEVNIEDECYGYESMIAKGIGGISFSDQDNWELVPNKFDITTLKPFDKVLVRQDVYGKWGINFFGFYNYDGYYYTTGNWIYKQCIPYEGNEYLLDTTDECDEFYKTW